MKNLRLPLNRRILACTCVVLVQAGLLAVASAAAQQHKYEYLHLAESTIVKRVCDDVAGATTIQELQAVDQRHAQAIAADAAELEQVRARLARYREALTRPVFHALDKDELLDEIRLSRELIGRLEKRIGKLKGAAQKTRSCVDAKRSELTLARAGVPIRQNPGFRTPDESEVRADSSAPPPPGTPSPGAPSATGRGRLEAAPCEVGHAYANTRLTDRDIQDVIAIAEACRSTPSEETVYFKYCYCGFYRGQPCPSKNSNYSSCKKGITPANLAAALTSITTRIRNSCEAEIAKGRPNSSKCASVAWILMSYRPGEKEPNPPRITE